MAHPVHMSIVASSLLQDSDNNVAAAAGVFTSEAQEAGAAPRFWRWGIFSDSYIPFAYLGDMKQNIAQFSLLYVIMTSKR